MFKSTIIACVIVCVLWVASPVQAMLLLPGNSALATAEPDPVGGVAVAGPLISPLVGAAFSATVTSTVIANDATNPFGGLTFVYQVANSASSIDAISRFTANGYLGVMTDMSFQPSSTWMAPIAMDRSVNANVVGFSFLVPPVGPSALQPGMTSDLLVVQTNAHNFTISTGNVIDGSVATGPIYAPVPVPEPATVGLLGLGALGLLARRRR